MDCGGDADVCKVGFSYEVCLCIKEKKRGALLQIVNKVFAVE